jgi:hypothetical protein
MSLLFAGFILISNITKEFLYMFSSFYISSEEGTRERQERRGEMN